MERDLKYINENVDICLSESAHLSPRSADYIRALYGPTVTVTVPHDIEPAPTADEAFQKAQDDLNNAKRKGFIKDADFSKTQNPMYKRRILLRETLKPETEEFQDNLELTSDIQKLFAAEPYQEFYFGSDVVKSTIEEIKALPFIWPNDINIAMNKLNDGIASIVRLLNHENLLDEKRQNRSQLQKSMMLFVTQAKQVREKLMRDMITEKKLNTNKLTKKQKLEFQDLVSPPKPKQEQSVSVSVAAAPKKPDPQAAETDRKLIEHVVQNCDKLPNQYKIDMEEINEDNRKVFKKETKKLLHYLPKKIKDEMSVPLKHISTAQSYSNINSSPVEQTIDKKQKKKVKIIGVKSTSNLPIQESFVSTTLEPAHLSNEEEVHELYWKTTDPLDTRQGEPVNTLNIISEYSSDLQFCKPEVDDSQLPNPFEFISKAHNVNDPDTFPSSPTHLASREYQPDLMKNVWNTSGIIRSDVAPSPSGFESGLLTEQDFALLNADMKKRKNRDLQFLLGQSHINIIEETKGSIHERLEDIWKELGCSIQQKLEFLLKYSKESEESQKLGEALEYWEQAVTTVERYTKSYESYRDFLKYEVRTCVYPQTTIKQFETEYFASKELVENIAQSLLTTYEDVLIIKRKKYSDIINSRTKKLMNMKSLYCKNIMMD